MQRSQCRVKLVATHHVHNIVFKFKGHMSSRGFSVHINFVTEFSGICTVNGFSVVLTRIQPILYHQRPQLLVKKQTEKKRNKKRESDQQCFLTQSQFY